MHHRWWWPHHSVIPPAYEVESTYYHPTETSKQPKATTFGIQAQLNLLIKVGQEKSRVT